MSVGCVLVLGGRLSPPSSCGLASPDFCPPAGYKKSIFDFTMEEGIRQGVLRGRSAAPTAYSFFGAILSSAVYEALHGDKRMFLCLSFNLTRL